MTADPKLLYIEDDPIIRRAIVTYMSNLGYSMLQAADGQEGLEIFRREDPDIILTDLWMPKVDGLQILAAVKDEAPDTPVIIISGMGTLDDAIRALKLGAWDYITKPVKDMALVEHAVVKAMERAELIRENKRYQTYLEEEVEKRTSELIQARKLEALGSLASGVAHDFNNLLNVILGYADLLLRDTPKASHQYSQVLEISKAGQRATDLAKQILTFGRQADQESVVLRLQSLIREGLHLLRGSLPATIEISEKIDDSCGPVYADQTQVHQVIMNLCTNAYHAMQEKGGRLEIELEQSELARDEVVDLPPGPYARLRVTDTGYGIAPEIVERIFEPYFTTKKQGEGTGLGLATVHGIVKRHKGEILVASELGVGTTFTVYLPVVARQVMAEEGQKKFEVPDINKRVLFVDDSLFNVQLGQEMLRSMGCEVLGQSDSEAALQLFLADPAAFDLIITDQTMPKMTGMELAGKILEVRPTMPIIIASGHTDLVDDKRAGKVGIKAFLMKPLRFDILARAICRVTNIGENTADQKGSSEIDRNADDTCLLASPPVPKKGVNRQTIRQGLITKFGLQPERVDLLLSGAQDELYDLLANMDIAQKADDYNELFIVAHSLKGCLSNLGAKDWAEVAAFIEKSAREQKPCQYACLVQKLRAGLTGLLPDDKEINIQP